ncbi:ABC transporter permease [Acetobacterium malicum]|uniref:ABC transporter permease n=1 Tax=Acetobacterium malicum TaxID=52692 RepID=UPI0035932569
MLGKLIKHETRATSRIFLPLYGALLILTIFTKLVMAIGAPDFFSEAASNNNNVAEIILGISFTLYFVLIIGICVMTLVMIIQRFYKNLFTDEGYLMFSLPVKTWELVLSKLLVGMIWSAVCTVMIVLTFFIFSLGAFSMMELSQTIRSAYSMFYLQTGMELNLFMAELIIFILVETVASILMIYVSIAIGQLFNQHRIVAAFGAYIVITIAMQIIMSIAMAVFAIGNLENMVLNGSEAMTTVQWLINGSTALNVVLGIGFYYVTHTIMKKRLNLE